VRVDEEGGGSGKLAHTTTLENLRLFQGASGRGRSPLKSEERV
jgi:hypothetical protein